jgi:hypothetical protein
MYPRKRKSSFSCYQDDDEEDVWEREASVASSSNRYKTLDFIIRHVIKFTTEIQNQLHLIYMQKK